MKIEIVYQQDDHTWYAIGRDPDRHDCIIDTNEYLIVSGGKGTLLDPGGLEIFQPVIEAVSQIIDLRDIENIFCSHQDPDIASALGFWMGVCTEAKLYVSWLWDSFISYYGKEHKPRFMPIPDEGLKLSLPNKKQDLEIIPAHYCHSAGNFSVYDPNAKILFSGDIGGTIEPSLDFDNMFVKDITTYLHAAESFHTRWFPSNKAKNAWIKRVRQMPITHMCPQHGAIMVGEQIKQFLDWFERLEVGKSV